MYKCSSQHPNTNLMHRVTEVLHPHPTRWWGSFIKTPDTRNLDTKHLQSSRFKHIPFQSLTTEMPLLDGFSLSQNASEHQADISSEWRYCRVLPTKKKELTVADHILYPRADKHGFWLPTQANESFYIPLDTRDWVNFIENILSSHLLPPPLSPSWGVVAFSLSSSLLRNIFSLAVACFNGEKTPKSRSYSTASPQVSLLFPSLSPLFFLSFVFFCSPFLQFLMLIYGNQMPSLPSKG